MLGNKWIKPSIQEDKKEKENKHTGKALKKRQKLVNLKLEKLN